MHYGNCKVLPRKAATCCGEVGAFQLPSAAVSLSLACHCCLSPATLPNTARFRVINSFGSWGEQTSDGRAPTACLYCGSSSREAPGQSHSPCLPPLGNSF